MSHGDTTRCPNTGALIFAPPQHLRIAKQAAAKVKQLEEKVSKLEEQNAKLLEAVEALLKTKEG